MKTILTRIGRARPRIRRRTLAVLFRGEAQAARIGQGARQRPCQPRAGAIAGTRAVNGEAARRSLADRCPRRRGKGCVTARCRWRYLKSAPEVVNAGGPMVRTKGASAVLPRARKPRKDHRSPQRSTNSSEREVGVMKGHVTSTHREVDFLVAVERCRAAGDRRNGVARRSRSRRTADSNAPRRSSTKHERMGGDGESETENRKDGQHREVVTRVG